MGLMDPYRFITFWHWYERAVLVAIVLLILWCAYEVLVDLREWRAARTRPGVADAATVRTAGARVAAADPPVVPAPHLHLVRPTHAGVAPHAERMAGVVAFPVSQRVH